MKLYDQFEIGKLDNYKRDYYKYGRSWGGYSWIEEQDVAQRHSKFEYTNSTETSENDDGFIFRIPLSEISIENLKIILEKNYIIVGSNKKTIFINLNHRVNIDTLTTKIKGGNLIIEVKK